MYRSAAQFSPVGYRTQLFNPADLPNGVKIQSGYTVRPLSAYLGKPAPSAAPKINLLKFRQALPSNP